MTTSITNGSSPAQAPVSPAVSAPGRPPAPPAVTLPGSGDRVAEVMGRYQAVMEHFLETERSVMIAYLGGQRPGTGPPAAPAITARAPAALPPPAAPSPPSAPLSAAAVEPLQATAATGAATASPMPRRRRRPRPRRRATGTSGGGAATSPTACSRSSASGPATRRRCSSSTPISRATSASTRSSEWRSWGRSARRSRSRTASGSDVEELTRERRCGR